MKKHLIFILANLLISTLISAQSTDGFKYQAIIRDAAGNVNANASVSMEISILQGAADGTAVFTETHNVVSNAYGLVNLTIGSQNPTDFNLIDWANGPYFIKIIVDGVEFGTSQLLSVPYALHAKSSEKATLAETAENYTETDPLFTASSASTITQTQIENWTNKLESFNETDPVYIASVVASITQSDIDNWNNKLDEYLETDPTFSNHPSFGISNQMLKNWDSAYQWGNHQSEAYLKSFTETDPIFTEHPSFVITAEDIVKWKALWIWYTNNEMGYLKANTPAGGITAIDTANWNRMSGQSLKLSDVIAVNDSANGQIKNLSNPTHNQDAVTKIYLDSIMAQFYLDVLSKVKDADNNTYNTVDIGSQTWMATNLRTTQYNDGTDIPLGSTDSATWVDMTTPGYDWYNHDSTTYAGTYGALYNWFTVDTSILCPIGWHVPDSSEWNTLINFLGGEDVAGGKLREAGTSHWEDPNTGATNTSGFTALPGGMRNDAEFWGLGAVAVWWSSTNVGINGEMVTFMDETAIRHDPYIKNSGFSVRCIKN